jgi:aryl-alcohol dehydrogenase-like predicted oxidoreductase
MERRPLGRAGLELTRVALGTAPLGGLYTAVDDAQARATVDAAWELGVRTFDTAPHYGAGVAERRLGEALRGRPRDQLVLSTKVGRLLRPGAKGPSMFAGEPPVARVFDFSRDGVRRSLEGSLERLGVDRVDIVHVHDPDDHLDEALAGALPALAELRDAGVIGAVGAGMNAAAPLARIVREADVDCVLVAGRLTLLDQGAADELLPLCLERDVAVLAGGVFNSGVLTDPRPGATYDYAPAPPQIVERARALAAICARHGVPLAAAALAFPLRHPAVASVVVGARTPREIRDDIAHLAHDVPDELWRELGSGR